MGISSCPDMNVNTKHLLLLSSLNTHKCKGLSTPLGVCKLTAAAVTHRDIRHGMMMASFMCKTLTLLIICMALQEGCGLPLSDRAELPAPHQHRVRTKRCSCNSWDDKECIYFCHLDIIWVNTPSKLLPYGLGSPPSRRRRRRSADRCECLNPADKTCSGFCHQSSENPRTNVVGPLAESASTNRNNLLASFRSVVKSNTVIAKEFLLSHENPGSVNRLRNRTRR